MIAWGDFNFLIKKRILLRLVPTIGPSESINNRVTITVSGYILEHEEGISDEERHLKVQQLVNSMLHQFVNK